MKKILNNKVVKLIASILKGIFMLMLILFIFMVCLQRFSNNELSLFNFRIFTVISGSMEPKYKIGDVLISVETDPKDIKVGDVISYHGEKRDVKGKVVTHQVIDIEKDESGKYYFHTKGICENCLVEDPVVEESQVYGVVKYKVKTLSAIYKVVGTKVGLFFFIILPLFYIIGSEIIYTLIEKEEERRKKKN